MYNKKSFNYQNVFRGIALMLSVLTLSFAVNYFAFAWTEPSVAPPGGNAPAPLNVSFSDQSKEGKIGIGGVFAPAYSLDIRDSIGLGTLRTTGGALLNTGGAATGLIVQNGNVGIGTTAPAAKLEISDGGAAKNTINRPFSVHGSTGGATIHTAAFYNNLANSTFFGYGLVLGARPSDNYGSIQAGRFNANGVLGGTGNDLKLILNENGGNVGIGTAAPRAVLDVVGDDGIIVDGDGSSSEIKFRVPGTDGVKNTGDDYYFKINTPGEWDRIKISATVSDDGLTPGFGGIATFKRNGWVGIGTQNPRAALHVVGDEVVIDSGAADGSPEINLVDSSGSGDVSWRIGSGTGNYLSIDSGLSADWNTGASPNWDMIFRYVDASNSANVGIGTGGNPGAKLDVNGNVKIGSVPAQANKALCWRADKTIGYCSTQPDATGSCACNAIN